MITVGSETITLSDLDYSYYMSGDGTHGEYQLNTPEVGLNATLEDWDANYDIDPQVTNNFTVTNTTLAAQVFTVSVTSPIAPVAPTSLMRGSIGITLTDQGPLDGNGDTDGVAVPATSLMADPYSLSCTPFNCSTSDSENFGIPVRIPGRQLGHCGGKGGPLLPPPGI